MQHFADGARRPRPPHHKLGMTLEGDLREKIKVHVQQYLEADATALKSGPLSRIKVYSYIQDRDRFLARKKKVQLEKLIDSVCRDLEAQKLQSEEPQNTIEIEDDDPNEEQEIVRALILNNRVSLTGLQADRTMNKGITDSWNFAVPEGQRTTTTTEATTKRKERPSIKESKSKRPKGKKHGPVSREISTKPSSRGQS